MADPKTRTTTPVPGLDRPPWRHPAVLVVIGLALLLIVAWAFRTGEPSPPVAVGASVDSPVGQGADLQWPDAVGTQNASGGAEADAKAPEPPGRTFIARLNLQPRMRNGRVNGYTVRPDDPAMLNGTLLQTGDVLLEVDGLELDPARAALLAKDVGDYQDVYVRLERGNRQQEGVLSFGGR